MSEVSAGTKHLLSERGIEENVVKPHARRKC
jgi:hypothetical protein